MVVKIEHFFAAKMQLKCNRCPEASIDRPLTEVLVICVLGTYYPLSSKLFGEIVHYFLEVRPKEPKFLLLGEQTHFFVVSIK